MLKSDLESVIYETNRKLDDGINVTVHVRDHRPVDAIICGTIIGLSFMLSSLVVDEIRKSYVRSKNKKWYEKMKNEKKL